MRSWWGIQHFKQCTAAPPSCRDKYVRANAPFWTIGAKEVSPKEEKDSTYNLKYRNLDRCCYENCELREMPQYEEQTENKRRNKLQ